MENKEIPELREWVVFTDNKNIEPHFHLEGDVYGDERFYSGEFIMTSRVISIIDGIATTKSGRQYRLGHCRRFRK